MKRIPLYSQLLSRLREPRRFIQMLAPIADFLQAPACHWLADSV